MMNMKTIEVEQASEEVIGGEGQTPSDEMFKEDNFSMILRGKGISIGRMPLHHFFILKKASGNKLLLEHMQIFPSRMLGGWEVRMVETACGSGEYLSRMELGKI